MEIKMQDKITFPFLMFATVLSASLWTSVVYFALK